MKKDYIFLSLAALLTYFVHALAWPLAAGRDGFSYLYYAYDFFSKVPEDRFTMLFRTPLAPLFDWFLVSCLPPIAAEGLMGFIFLGTILLLYRAGLHWNRAIGLTLATLMLAHSGWASLFHVISNDPPVAILVPILLWATLRAMTTPHRPGSFFCVGLLAALLSLTRPGIFPAVVLLPLLLYRLSWRKKLIRIAACGLPCLLILGGWGLHNLKKHGVFAIAPGADVVLPLGRVLGKEQILREENGPNSKILADAVRKDLLVGPRAGISVNEYFFTHPSYFDYMVLAEQNWGSYSVLKGAAWEAVRAFPLQYAGGVATTIFLTFAGNLKLPVPLKNGARVHTHKGHISYTLLEKDQWVPITDFDFHAPLGKDGVLEKMEQKGPNSVRAWKKISAYPVRDGMIQAGTVLNWLAYLFPPMLLWVFATLLWPCGGWQLNEKELGLFFLWGLAAATNILASFSIWSVVYEYRLPFDPVYILAGLLALQRMPYLRKITAA